MTNAQIYQSGIKAYIDGRSLKDNPYDNCGNHDACEAWTEGWLEASRARCRIHALEIAARPHFKASMRAASFSAQGL
jgi:ribosome modulation factor